MLQKPQQWIGDNVVIVFVSGCFGREELHPNGMPPHPGYGVGRTLWRADVARQAAAQRQEEADIERLRANPEQATRLLQQLQAAGFDLPARKSEKSERARPSAE